MNGCLCRKELVPVLRSIRYTVIGETPDKHPGILPGQMFVPGHFDIFSNAGENDGVILENVLKYREFFCKINRYLFRLGRR